jgi:isopentenyl diphosphate isomerase/L-lactate dehydrogenase-like FMN-dependent dehydrogenase
LDDARDLRAEFLTLHEFVAEARARLDANGWDYLVGGTETETTVARNRAALDAIAFRPRVLVDVSEIDTTADFLGAPVRLPVLLAPVGGLETFAPGGVVAAAEGAGAFGVPVMASSVSRRTKQEVREATRAPATFQLYVRGTGRFIEDEIEAAAAAGHDAFCLTVDSALYSRRERDIVKRFDKPWRQGVDAVAVRAQAALSWADVARVRKTCPIPLILKGIMTAEDARIATEHGVDAVYVSNHGGRQLDHGVGAMDVLPEIADATGGRAKLIVDGGFCRGTDIVKAMAFGAHSVGLGRLYCYGLAAAGPAGVVRLLEVLEEEVRSALGLVGVTRFAELTPEHVRRGAPLVAVPHVHSAFPLLPPR